jgi:hypothetical protein
MMNHTTLVIDTQIATSYIGGMSIGPTIAGKSPWPPRTRGHVNAMLAERGRQKGQKLQKPEKPR